MTINVLQIILQKTSLSFIQSPSNACKRFGFYEVNLGTLKIEYHGLKMQLHS